MLKVEVKIDAGRASRLNSGRKGYAAWNLGLASLVGKLARLRLGVVVLVKLGETFEMFINKELTEEVFRR